MEKHIKTTVEIKKEYIDMFCSIRCNRFDHRTMKYIINQALKEYFFRREEL